MPSHAFSCYKGHHKSQIPATCPKSSIWNLSRFKEHAHSSIAGQVVNLYLWRSQNIANACLSHADGTGQFSKSLTKRANNQTHLARSKLCTTLVSPTLFKTLGPVQYIIFIHQLLKGNWAGDKILLLSKSQILPFTAPIYFIFLGSISQRNWEILSLKVKVPLFALKLPRCERHSLWEAALEYCFKTWQTTVKLLDHRSSKSSLLKDKTLRQGGNLKQLNVPIAIFGENGYLPLFNPLFFIEEKTLWDTTWKASKSEKR